MAGSEQEFPLFPLGIVALPTEAVPLHIFEERYKTMIGRCLEEESEFGIVWMAEDGLRPIGCACWTSIPPTGNISTISGSGGQRSSRSARSCGSAMSRSSMKSATGPKSSRAMRPDSILARSRASPGSRDSPDQIGRAQAAAALALFFLRVKSSSLLKHRLALSI